MCELDLETDPCSPRMISKPDLYLVTFTRTFERSHYEKFRKAHCRKKFVCCAESPHFDEKMRSASIRSRYESEVIVILIFFLTAIHA